MAAQGWIRSLEERPANDWSCRQRTIEPPGQRADAQARGMDVTTGDETLPRLVKQLTPTAWVVGSHNTGRNNST